MGIREVMVIVGGKSVGDVVELLGDGTTSASSLPTLPAGRWGSPTLRARPGVVGPTTRPAWSWATTSSAARLAPTWRARSRMARGVRDALYEVPDPARFGVAELDPSGAVLGSRRSRPAEEQSHPHRGLLPPPDAFDVSPRWPPPRARRAGDHRSAEPLHPGGGLYAPRNAGHWTDAGTVASLLRAAELAPPPTPRGKLPATAPAADGVTAPGPGPAFSSPWRRVHRELLRPRRPRPARRHADHRLDKLTYAGNLAKPGDRHRRSGGARPVRLRPGDIADASRWARWRPTRTPSSTSREKPRRHRSILDRRPSSARTWRGPTSSWSRSAARRSGPRRGAGPPHRASSGLHRRGVRLAGDGRLGEDAPLRRRLAVRRGQGRRRPPHPLVPGHLRDRRRRHRGSNTYGPFHHRRSSFPLFITNAPRRPAAAALRRRAPAPRVAPRQRPRRRVAHVLAHGAAGEVYNVPGADELATATWPAGSSACSPGPGSLSGPSRPAGHDRRYAMDGSRLRALGWTNRVTIDEGLAATVAWYRDNPAWCAAAEGRRLERLLRPPVR